jgi:hypothetical protein
MKRLLATVSLLAALTGCGGPMGGQAGMYNYGDGTGACTDATMFGKCKFTKQRQCCADPDPWKCSCSASCPCHTQHPSRNSD